MPDPTSPTSPLTVDVLIVGFGPVGKLLAIQLGRRGHDVLVVDREQAAYPLPRAVTHDSDFARILQSVGLSPDTIPEITQPYDDMYVWRNHEGQTLVEVDWKGRGESGWYNTYFFHQPALEDALDRVIDGLPSVRVMRGWEAGQFSQDVETASATLRAPSTGEALAVTARWMIGADGANSTVRQWAGIEWHDEGYFHDWLVVDVKPRPGLEFPHVATQSCDTQRPATMVPGGPGRRRWEFMRLPHETKAELNRTDKAWELLAPYGLTPENADLERHSLYTFQACWATRWREGRFLLAGDAAHLMPPFAGQGLGAGVRDVMNLGWKLDAVLRGLADQQILDTYGTERLQHAVAFVKFSMQLGQVICITDPDEAAARDARMIADWAAGMKPPAPPRPGLGPGIHTGPAGGHLARQGRVRVHGGEPRMFDDAFGGPGALIARSTTALADLPHRVQTGLKDLGVTLVALAGPETTGVTAIEDVDGVYASWLDELGADVVLVRPDFHVYGTGHSGEAAELATGFLTRLGGLTRAVGVVEFGGPEALHVVDLPAEPLGPGQVRIRVAAATVNPVDMAVRAGRFAQGAAVSDPPSVPGMDAAGVLTEVGPDVDTDLVPGDHVMAIVVPDGPHGGYREDLVVPAGSVARAPAGVSDVEAATLPMNGLTARQALDLLGLRPGQVLAVSGAAGALGGYVVQLAKADGLIVVADAAEADEQLVRELGADVVVRRGEGVADRIRQHFPDGVDAAADGAALHEALTPAVREGGRFVSVRGWTGDGQRGIEFLSVASRRYAQNAEALDRLRQLVEDGAVTLRVAHTFPAEQAAEAHRMLGAGGVRGRVVLTF